MTVQERLADLPDRRTDRNARSPSPSPEAESFYAAVLHELLKASLPFLVGGGYAVSAYTGLQRPTKDLDIFTTAGTFPRVLSHLRERGHSISVEDERWIGKVHCGDDFLDVIFGSANGMVPVQEQWFAKAKQVTILGFAVPMLSPTELIWSKVYIQNRHRYDGADVIHVVLKQHDEIDWQRLLSQMDAHWEILFAHLLKFGWVYPSERHHVPRWLMEELLDRMRQQLELPPSRKKICRGPVLSQFDYRQAVAEWGYADGEERNG